jgi:hypothetical protein
VEEKRETIILLQGRKEGEERVISSGLNLDKKRSRNEGARALRH